MPSSFPPTSDETRGHREQGRTLAVHSVAVLPEYQGRGVGKTILQAYLQRMNSAGIADRVALLAHRPLCEFYRKQGFTDDGANESKLYGGGWINMVGLAPIPLFHQPFQILFFFLNCGESKLTEVRIQRSTRLRWDIGCNDMQWYHTTALPVDMQYLSLPLCLKGHINRMATDTSKSPKGKWHSGFAFLRA